MRTTILQVCVLTNSLFHMWFHTFIPGAQASHPQQCGHTLQEEPWDHPIFNLTYVHTPLPDAKIFEHSNQDVCPSFHSLFHHDHLSAQHLSLCPWVYVKHYDPDRFPSQLSYARCSCKKCDLWGHSGLKRECRPHYHAFNVIRRVCVDGHYKHYHTHEYLPIACVCSHEHMRIVDSFGDYHK